MDSYVIRAVICAVLVTVLFGIADSDVGSGTFEYGHLVGDWCHFIPNCFACKNQDIYGRYICTKCNEPLFYLDTESDTALPTCVRCTSLPGCLACYSKQRCSRCINPDPRNPNLYNGPNLKGDLGYCGACAANCKFCNESGIGKCDQCALGYYVDALQKCSECSIECASCKNATYCYECDSGYYRLRDGTCQPCAMQNCARCQNSGVNCLSCRQGTISNSGHCACADNCASCSTSGYGLCDQCNDNYQLNSDRTCSPVSSWNSPEVADADMNRGGMWMESYHAASKMLSWKEAISKNKNETLINLALICLFVLWSEMGTHYDIACENICDFVKIICAKFFSVYRADID